MGFDYGFNWYLLDSPAWDLFLAWGGAFGWGFVTQQDVDEAAEVTSYSEVGGYLGVGTDVRIDDWFLTAELRLPILVLTDVERRPSFERDYTRTRENARVALYSAVGFGYRF